MAAASKGRRGPAPVHLWDPPYCGEMDLEIRPDGAWIHEGSPIGRPAMVRLFLLDQYDDAERDLHMIGMATRDGGPSSDLVTESDCLGLGLGNREHDIGEIAGQLGGGVPHQLLCAEGLRGSQQQGLHGAQLTIYRT